MAQIIEGVQNKKTYIDIYKEIVIKNPEYAPKDLQQVHSNKHYKSSNATVDDEMANVLSLDNKHDFVQEVVYAKDNKKPPSIICYVNDQLTNCFICIPRWT